jgi:hypothetical protein
MSMATQNSGHGTQSCFEAKGIMRDARSWAWSDARRSVWLTAGALDSLSLLLGGELMSSLRQSNSIQGAAKSRFFFACSFSLMIGAGLLAPSLVRADWDVGDTYKMHYPQLPDLTPTGLDVLATRDPQVTGPNGPLWKVLADDFRCTQTGPITDIHIWGSWLNDEVYTGVQFKLSIHADQPATATSPSLPIDPPLWQTTVAPSAQRLYSALPPTVGPEQFYDPNINQIIGTDRQIWQYNFVNIPEPFIQQAGKIYWLDVQALVPAGTPFLFGWKTTNPQDPRTPHFQDDAVWADTPAFGAPPITPYVPLVYPAGHPYAGLSIDLAFVITGVPEPASVTLMIVGVMFAGIGGRRRER